MAAHGNSPATLGFLTVVSDPEHGLFGGYLALNAAGRPLEFHCTAPVKANRAQEILYGNSLAPYLYGELIGGTLAARAKTPPRIVFTDQPPVLAVRAAIEAPVVLLLPPAGQEPSPDSPTAPNRRLIEFRLGEHRVAVAADYGQDRTGVEEAYCGPLVDFDFAEPFSRIREALQEARPTTNAAAPKPARPNPAA